MATVAPMAPEAPMVPKAPAMEASVVAEVPVTMEAVPVPEVQVDTGAIIPVVAAVTSAPTVTPVAMAIAPPMDLHYAGCACQLSFWECERLAARSGKGRGWCQTHQTKKHCGCEHIHCSLHECPPIVLSGLALSPG